MRWLRLAVLAALLGGCTEQGDQDLFKHVDGGPLDAPPAGDAAPAEDAAPPDAR